jgi:hypothetical protein
MKGAEMKRGLLIVFSAAALAGCAPMVWDKAGVTQDDYNQDSYQCERDTRQSGYFGGGVVGAMNQRDFFKRCMVAHGYTLRTS